MNINPIVLSIPIFFLLIGIELIVERLTRKKYYRLNDALTNLSCGITQQVSGVFLKLFGIGLYVLVYEKLRLWDIPSNWYTFLILFVLTDLAYYWAHRMSHEINLFWSAHVVHHQSEDLLPATGCNWLRTTRFCPGQCTDHPVSILGPYPGYRQAGFSGIYFGYSLAAQGASRPRPQIH